MAGAFAGAALTFVTYREAFEHFDGGTRAVTGATATAGIFATYPPPFLSLGGGFVDQVVSSLDDVAPSGGRTLVGLGVAR